MLMERDLTPEEIEKHNNRKLTADKIRQILSKVMETPTQSSKRWVWELMQNAKDIPNRFGEVSIKIELTENSLKFLHNGNPFSLKNIMGLIQQVSSKDSTNSNEEVTGKFGTGFISTHLLSRTISVKGFVLHNGIHRKFDIDLDRSGDSSEDLIPKIKTALEHISKIEDNQIFPIESNYENNRTEQSFDTSFEYKLISDKSKKWASDGIDDLVNTLPQTLVNLQKIKKVTVINKGIQEIYTKKKVDEKDGATSYEVEITNQESKKFISYGKDEITLAIEVNNFNPITLIEHFGQQPNLFRDFPLIGSEKFHFPYILNGHTFNPTEDRDSIVLHSEESKESIENRKSVENAISVSQEFTKWLISNNAVNRHICAYTRRPELKSTWEDFSKNWYSEIQTNWRKQLIELPLFETEKGDIIDLKNAIIPEDGDSKEFKEEFYEISKPVFSSNRIPKKDKHFDWLKILGPKSDKEQRENWGINLSKNVEDLAQIISDFEDKEGLLNNTELVDIGELNLWLNSLYSYLIKTQQTDLLSKYALIPNQYGIFKKLNELHLEDPQNSIPDELLDVLDKLGKHWRTDLIDRKINIGLSIDSKGCSEISETINGILKKEQGPHNNKISVFLQRTDAREILTDILKLQTINSTTDNFQYKLFNFGKALFNTKDIVINIENLSPFSFFTTIKLYIELIHKEIQSLEGLSGLQEKLEKTEEDSLFWLNQYLNLIQSNSGFKTLLEENIRIIPNRYKEFITYENAKSFGTEETPLDYELVDILFKLNSQEDWKGFLVHNGIHIDFNDKCKFEELSQSIEENISAIQTKDYQNPDEGILKNYKNPILALIKWIKDSKNKTLADLYLSTFINESKSLYFKLFIDNSNIDISAIELLQDKDSVNLLVKIQESSVSTKDIADLIDIVTELGSTELLKQRAEDLREEKRNREFLYQVGEKVEEAIKNTLTEFNVEKISVGAFDLKISNDEKSYFLEVKSFKNNSSYPFLFAPSQASRAMLNEPNYAVCTIERPLMEVNEISVEYVKNNLLFAKNLSLEFSKGVQDFSKYKEIRSNHSISKLKIDVLGEVRVEVDKNAIINKSKDFDNLINDIRKELTNTQQCL
jgi:predicted RNA-binding protein Jag